MASWTRGRPGSENVPPVLHRRVVSAFGRQCYLCGQPYSQIDHVIPWSQGGTTLLPNLRPICTECHAVKSESEKLAGIQKREARKRRPTEPHPSEGLKPPS